MNSFTFLFICFQACLIQVALSQSKFGPGLARASAKPALLGYNGASTGLTGPGYGGPRYPNDLPLGLASAKPLAATPPAIYSGTGEGGVSAAGELPVVGTTVINGQVPMIGAVKFNGDMPASGIVTITGTCSCGSNSPLIY